MHIVRIDGEFPQVSARSEFAHKSHHVDLKDILSKTQKSFIFNQVQGSLVCMYFPDYMQGINAAGLHFHFISEDHRQGGHVFEVSIAKAKFNSKKQPDSNSAATRSRL